MQIEVSHAVSGQISESTLTGDGIAALKSWMKDLELEKMQFEEGNTPGDTDGGEMYVFKMAGGSIRNLPISKTDRKIVTC